MISIAREVRGRDSSNEPFAQQPVTVPFSCPSLRLRDPIALASERERAGAIKASKDTKTSAEKFDVGRKKKKNDERDSICSAEHLRLRWFFVASPPCPLPSDPLSLFHRHALCDPLSALIEREMPKTRKNPNISSLSHHQRHERDVRRVHGLEAEAGRRAVEVGVGDELLDGVEELLKQGALLESGLEPG